MLRKESKFYVINFIDPRIIFFFKKNLKPRALKRIFRYRIKKVTRKKGDVRKGCKWIRTTLLLMLRYIDF